MVRTDRGILLTEDEANLAMTAARISKEFWGEQQNHGGNDLLRLARENHAMHEKLEAAFEEALYA